MSKRLLYATLFGIIVIGGALYYTYKTPPNGLILSEEAESISATWETTSTSSTPSNGLIPETTISETDLLTQNVIGPYIDQLQNETYTKADSDLIIENATREMFTLQYTPIELKDIILSDDTSKDAALTYKQNLYDATKPLFALEEYELSIYAAAVENNSKELFDSLLAIATIYTKAGDTALASTAPQDVSVVHLSIVNSLYKFSTVLTLLAKGYDDPAASLSGAGNFTQVENELEQAFTSLKTYFTLKEITNTTL